MPTLGAMLLSDVTNIVLIKSSTGDLLQQAAERMEPRLRAAFLRAIAALRGTVADDKLTDAVAAGVKADKSNTFRANDHAEMMHHIAAVEHSKAGNARGAARHEAIARAHANVSDQIRTEMINAHKK
jgi:hypothetical protein